MFQVLDTIKAVPVQSIPIPILSGFLTNSSQSQNILRDHYLQNLVQNDG